MKLYNPAGGDKIQTQKEPVKNAMHQWLSNRCMGFHSFIHSFVRHVFLGVLTRLPKFILGSRHLTVSKSVHTPSFSPGAYTSGQTGKGD
jgi:hypothetical protein